MDASALTDLLRRHARAILQVAYAYCPNVADREDLVQEVAIQLWRSRLRFDPMQGEIPWVHRIALNVAISFHRRERRHRERRERSEIEGLTLAAETEAPSEDVLNLRAAIADLPVMERGLVLLHLNGHDHRTIAEILGLSVTNVGTKLQRTKERLRAALEGRSPRKPE